MLQRFALARELEEVERRLSAAVSADEPLLSEMAIHTIGAGGKRVRPLSALLAFRAVGGGEERIDEVLDIAVGLELIHSATLIHDDINDGATERRGRPSCHERYGRANAIIAGDFLFTKGFQISGRFDRLVVDWTAEACRQLAEGEIQQARRLNRPVIDVDEYVLLVTRKTASFIQTGTQIGAYLGGANQETIEHMGAFGLCLGIAFQMIDDILDVVGDGTKTGKVVGIDIRDGNTTLPTLLAMRQGGDAAERIAAILGDPERTDADVEEALLLVRASGAIDEARSLAKQYGEKARAAIETLPPGDGRTHMNDLVDLVLGRDL